MTSWVVVGAGSAGCVVAGRLAEIPDHEVLLVEAGRFDLEPVDSDSFFDALADPQRIWPNLLAERVQGQAPMRYPRGRGRGGSSAVNAMVALEGGPYRAEHRLPVEPPLPGELGAVDRALLRAAPDARMAPLNRRNGRRVTTADAYLDSPEARGDRRGVLQCRGEALVDRVLTVGDRATGVRLVDGEEITADKVVLCAGAIHSPAILMRSRLDIAGVGDGLKDHPSAPVTLELVPEAIADPSSLVVGSLLSSADVQLIAMNHLGPPAPAYGLLLGAAMIVRSQGRVRLRDLDPVIDPEVSLNLLADPHDVQRLVAAVRLIRDLLADEAFRSICTAAYIDEHGTTIEALTDDAVIESWLRTHVGDYVHAGCSCRMGTVVDADCRVVGHENLYVCDTSVFTDLPTVNTHLPTVMLAETMVARWFNKQS